MTKTDLTRILAARNHATFKDAEEVVNLFFAAMAETLVEGDRVEIRGFGSFSVREYGSYTGRNPRSGEKLEVKPKRLPFFKASRELLGRLNGGPEQKGEEAKKGE